MTHIVIVQDDGELVDITDKVYKIFESTGRWPADWEDYVDTEIAVAILDIGQSLGLEGYAEKTAKYLEELRLQQVRRAQYEAERAAREQRRLEREAQREAQKPAVYAYLASMVDTLGARHVQTLAARERAVLGGREYRHVPGVGWTLA